MENRGNEGRKNKLTWILTGIGFGGGVVGGAVTLGVVGATPLGFAIALSLFIGTPVVGAVTGGIIGLVKEARNEIDQIRAQDLERGERRVQELGNVSPAPSQSRSQQPSGSQQPSAAPQLSEAPVSDKFVRLTPAQIRAEYEANR